jgi:hypothetical protein
MTSIPKVGHKLRVFFHSLGLSCLGGAIFLQSMVFTDILQHGYFRAIEQNPGILSFEIFLTAFALVYFLYMYLRFILSTK